MEGGNIIMDSKIVANQWTFGFGDKKKIIFETLVTPIILYVCEFWGCNIFRESWRKMEEIQKFFITYDIKIKRNTPYSILIETNPSPIESIAMIRYVIFKNHGRKKNS